MELDLLATYCKGCGKGFRPDEWPIDAHNSYEFWSSETMAGTLAVCPACFNGDLAKVAIENV